MLPTSCDRERSDTRHDEITLWMCTCSNIETLWKVHANILGYCAQNQCHLKRKQHTIPRHCHPVFFWDATRKHPLVQLSNRTCHLDGVPRSLKRSATSKCQTSLTSCTKLHFVQRASGDGRVCLRRLQKQKVDQLFPVEVKTDRLFAQSARRMAGGDHGEHRAHWLGARVEALAHSGGRLVGLGLRGTGGGGSWTFLPAPGWLSTSP